MDILRKEISDRGLDEFVKSNCNNEIQIFLFWKKYIESMELLEKTLDYEKQYLKRQFNYENVDLLNNPYIMNITDETIKKRIEYLKIGD